MFNNLKISLYEYCQGSPDNKEPWCHVILASSPSYWRKPASIQPTPKQEYQRCELILSIPISINNGVTWRGPIVQLSASSGGWSWIYHTKLTNINCEIATSGLRCNHKDPKPSSRSSCWKSKCHSGCSRYMWCRRCKATLNIIRR